MRIALPVAALLALVLPDPLAGQQPAADPLVGCYRLEVGAWDPPLHPGNAVYQTPPERVRLGAESGDGMFEWGKTVVRPVIPHGRTPSAFWHRTAADSVRLVWTNGHAGVQLDLRVAADSLHGRATARIDVVPPPGGPPAPSAAVVARPEPCAGKG